MVTVSHNCPILGEEKTSKPLADLPVSAEVQRMPKSKQRSLKYHKAGLGTRAYEQKVHVV